MSAPTDHYAVLGVPVGAQHEEIKQAYYALSRKIHPDKWASRTPDTKDSNVQNVEFHELSVAWETLSDPVRRKQYDQNLQASQNRSRGVVQDEVDLDEMDFDEDTGVYSYPCRCSGTYSIAESDMETGKEIAPCSGCSLKIRVLYEAADDYS
ncbi:hypothetical protein H4R99_003732 [Coemansia sp. RSA 1722]|nr:hypothetical protein LPJ57_006069 [Coemansia sp. RSA 486]KAJ2228188.1 hypothetical protein IWW45_006709 [Coemansia sp. RSA 485]KAJ2599385.1 hypothetical protein H4R99_003732 [Coemansia sp. RSA 1722]